MHSLNTSDNADCPRSCQKSLVQVLDAYEESDQYYEQWKHRDMDIWMTKPTVLDFRLIDADQIIEGAHEDLIASTLKRISKGATDCALCGDPIVSQQDLALLSRITGAKQRGEKCIVMVSCCSRCLVMFPGKIEASRAIAREVAKSFGDPNAEFHSVSLLPRSQTAKPDG
jgi:hypothetical protein